MVVAGSAWPAAPTATLPPRPRRTRRRFGVLPTVGALSLYDLYSGRGATEKLHPLGLKLWSVGFPPVDAELPLPLAKVHPIHEVVHVDYFLPGCPPSADVFWQFLTDLMSGRTPQLGHGLIHYD